MPKINFVMIPITGIIQLFISLILFYLAIRFHRIYLSEKSFVAKLFFLLFILFFLVFLVLGIPAISLTENQVTWKVALVLTCFFQVLIGGILGYIIFYLKFPKISPKWGFAIVSLIEIVLVIPSIIYPAVYFFRPNGVVDWDINPTVGILRYLGILIFVVPAGAVFLQQASSAKEKRIKIRALALGIGFLGFALVFLIDFILLNVFKFNPVWGDIILGGCFLILLLMIILTPRMIKHPTWVRFVR